MWAHPENKDIYPPEEFARLMRPADLPSTGPVVSMQLLGFINGKYLSAMPPAQLRDTFCDYLDYLIAENRLPYAPEKPENPLVDAQTAARLLAEIRENPDYAERVLALEPERNQKLSDLPENYSFFFASLFRHASAEVMAEICPDHDLARAILRDMANSYDPAASHEEWEAGMRALAARHGQKDKTVFMLTRVAVTGLKKTPPLYDIMKILRRAQGDRAVREGLKIIVTPDFRSGAYLWKSVQTQMASYGWRISVAMTIEGKVIQ